MILTLHSIARLNLNYNLPRSYDPRVRHINKDVDATRISYK